MGFRRPEDPLHPDNIKVECCAGIACNYGGGHYAIPLAALEQIAKLEFLNGYLYEACGPAADDIYDMAETAWQEQLDAS